MIQKVVGISFRPNSNPHIVVGTEVQLIHDADNEYSGKAIAVVCGQDHLGFIGEKDNPVHEEVFRALPLTGRISTMSRLAEGEEFAKFKPGEITHIEVAFPMESDSDGMIKSFNEDIYLTFLEKDHRYLYEGREFVSATGYIKKWINPFNEDAISATCAKKYGCAQEDVLGLWKGGGNVAAAFGTAIHNALEHYERYMWLGKIIQSQKGDLDNKAMPSHPVLREIVEGFYALHPQKHLVVPEALITNVELGLCGFADRVEITGDKTCVVEDYKVNVDAELESHNNKYLGKMAHLPKTKLSKYQMQMSFYARLLQLSGWHVEGLRTFVYDTEWKKYEMDILPMDF